MTKDVAIGVMFRRLLAPEQLIAYVQQAEAAGLDEVWIVEDLPFAGGISSVAVALANTTRIRIGLGIMPAVVRNPAFTAMEIATLERLFPGRVLPGIGHGVGVWMKQIGALPPSQLAALEETTQTVRSLLRGENVTFDGKYIHLHDVQLEYPPEAAPPISLGVMGPKSLQLSGRSADGTLLCEYSSPVYVTWAREQIAAGQRESGREGDAHRITVYVWCALADDRETAHAMLRPMFAKTMASGEFAPQFAGLGITQQIQQLVADGGVDNLRDNMSDAWLQQLAAAGTPQDCADAVGRWVDAGADSVVFVTVENDFAMLERITSEVLPLLS